jgi:NAD-dependent deacetylase
MTFDEVCRSVRPSPASPLVVLTGAGISAASGIPTFRGAEGYWTVGSTEYHPQEMATQAAWRRMPREVWRWYLYRKGVCDRAGPNDAHRGLVALEERLGDGFALITQNVDGLHGRAGSTRMFEIHGSLSWMRDDETRELVPLDLELALPSKDAPLDDARWARLVNPRTGNRCRPHVLWFDEYYEEALYRSESALRVARRASLFVIIGTSGATTLPWRAAEAANLNGAPIVDINPDDNPFRELAQQTGAFLAADALAGVAALASAF